MNMKAAGKAVHPKWLSARWRNDKPEQETPSEAPDNMIYTGSYDQQTFLRPAVGGGDGVTQG